MTENISRAEIANVICNICQSMQWHFQVEKQWAKLVKDRCKTMKITQFHIIQYFIIHTQFNNIGDNQTVSLPVC